MQGAIRIGGELPYPVSYKICCRLVVLRSSDVTHGCTLCIRDDVQLRSGKGDLRELIIPTQTMEPARFLGEQ